MHLWKQFCKDCEDLVKAETRGLFQLSLLVSPLTELERELQCFCLARIEAKGVDSQQVERC